MREEFMKNDRFHNGEFDAPVEFEMSDYDEAKKNSPYFSEQEYSEEEKPPTPEVPRPHLPVIKQEPISEDKGEPTTATENNDSTTAANPTPAEKPKLSRELKNLKDTLGPAWTCKEPHGRRVHRVTEIETKEDSKPTGTWDNVNNLDDATTLQEN